MQRLISIGVISTVLAFSGAALAQEGMPDMPDSVQQQKMEEFMKANQPGPEHGRLAKLAGNWEMTFSYWTEPGAEAITDTLRGSSEMVLGGRFLKTQSSGSTMGMPMEALNFIGFDGRHKEYTMIAFDNMGTYWVAARGSFNEETNTIEMSGTDEDPIFGFTQEYNFEMELVDENSYIFRVIFKDDMHTRGKVDAFKAVEVVARRTE